MYALHKNPLHFKKCYFQECTKVLTIFCTISSKNKTPDITFISQ